MKSPCGWGWTNWPTMPGAFGLGEKPKTGLPGENSGLVPTKEWKRNRYGLPWRPGESLTVVIGQGYLLATPIQMAQVASVVANGGTLFQSHLVKKSRMPTAISSKSSIRTSFIVWT